MIRAALVEPKYVGGLLEMNEVNVMLSAPVTSKTAAWDVVFVSEVCHGIFYPDTSARVFLDIVLCFTSSAVAVYC